MALGFACLCIKKILERTEKKLNHCETLGRPGWLDIDMSGRFVTISVCFTSNFFNHVTIILTLN